MSTAEATENCRTLSYAKWNEIVTKFCKKVLRDTCHDTVTGFSYAPLDSRTRARTSTRSDYPAFLAKILREFIKLDA